jgi:DNA-binding response OmpR family regulator
LALAAETRFDVVLLDVTMPDMNGYEVARALRAGETAPGPVIVMLSGRDIVEVDIAAGECGADGVMAKPVDRRKLLELLETLLRQRRTMAIP